MGESGCGKTTIARLILRIYELTSGEIIFEGREIQTLDRGELKKIYQRVQIIFQDPRTSLDPRMKVAQIIGSLWRSTGEGPAGEKGKRLELLSLTGSHPEPRGPVSPRIFRGAAAAHRHRPRPGH